MLMEEGFVITDWLTWRKKGIFFCLINMGCGVRKFKCLIMLCNNTRKGCDKKNTEKEKSRN